uniref:Secreted protein n=1 Tax=Setaria viridis TaxID=4556 RepID=A0A4U6TZZ6_SETVI|nr:hypothetical protein SEVIR_7G296603v2 [Setaria viridis]
MSMALSLCAIPWTGSATTSSVEVEIIARPSPLRHVQTSVFQLLSYSIAHLIYYKHLNACIWCNLLGSTGNIS